MDVFRLEDGAERCQLRVEERLTARKDDPANAQPADRGKVWFEIARPKCAILFCFPNITHHAAAVAGAVSMNHQDGQIGNALAIEIT
jgi:hypothetical protein